MIIQYLDINITIGVQNKGILLEQIATALIVRNLKYVPHLCWDLHKFIFWYIIMNLPQSSYVEESLNL